MDIKWKCFYSSCLKFECKVHIIDSADADVLLVSDDQIPFQAHGCVLCASNSRDHYEYNTRYKSNLKNHIYSKHEGDKYACNQFKYHSKQQIRLKKHKESKHL